MNSLLLRLVSALLVAASPGLAAVDTVVLPIAGIQPQSVRGATTEAVRGEVSALGLKVLTGPATQQVLADAAAFGNACTVTLATCAVQMGSLAGAPTVIVGALDATTLTLRQYDVGSQQETGRVVVPFDPGAPATAARLATIRLLRPDEEMGSLVLSVDVLGAVVEVDGDSRGTTPMGPILLRPGSHTVVVRPLEFEFKSQDFIVDIALGAVTSHEVTFRQRGTRPPRPGITSPEGNLPIFVLDVEAPPELALPAALITVGVADAIRERMGDAARVGSPQDFDRLHAGASSRIGDCAADPTCIRGRLKNLAPIELVTASVSQTEHTLMVTIHRFRLEGDTASRESGSADTHRTAGVAVTRLVDGLVGKLFPEGEGRAYRSAALAARFDPPIVPVAAWVGTVGGIAVGAGVSAAAIIGVTSTPPDDPLRPVWTAGVVGGAVLAAVGIAATVFELPFVDWQGLRAENAQLLEERAERYSSR